MKKIAVFGFKTSTAMLCMKAFRAERSGFAAASSFAAPLLRNIDTPSQIR